MEDLVKVTVDGRELQVASGTLLWEACKAHGIDIPVFCYHTKLGPVGACRTCLVEQQGVTKGPITACSTPVADGMVIRTRSATIQKAQKAIFEFLLANHPLDCPICDRGGECPLQDQTFAYGPGTSRYIEPRRHHVKPIVLGPTIALDRERCVLCWRCVRFCAEVAEDKSIVLLDRGEHSMVGTFESRPYVSNFSGNVVELCPVGALTSRKQRFNFRPWELQNRPSICPHCSLGCNINISVRKNDEVIRFLSRDNPEVDNSWLCDRGRFGFAFINSPQRLEAPMIRREEGFVQVSWTEALTYIADRLGIILQNWGPESVVGVASPALTNEDLFVFRRFMTEVIGSDHVDHSPRPELALTPEQQEAYDELSGAATSISALQRAKTILLVGADPSLRTPVLELRIREAVNRHGARLVVLGEGEIPLASKAHARATFAPEAFVSSLADLTAAVSGSPGGSDSSELADLARDHLAAGPIVVIYDDSFPDVGDKGAALEAVAALIRALQGAGEVGAIPLLDAANSMGARMLGMFPRDATRSRWGRSLLDALLSRSIPTRAAFIVGADIVAERGQPMAERLSAVDLVVVQDLFLTETARCADVILPSASFAEKHGTFVNIEGRVQSLWNAVPAPGIARSDWEILVDLSQYLQKPLDYALPEEVWEAIRAAVPAFQGLSLFDLGPTGARPRALQPA